MDMRKNVKELCTDIFFTLNRPAAGVSSTPEEADNAVAFMKRFFTLSDQDVQRCREAARQRATPQWCLVLQIVFAEDDDFQNLDNPLCVVSVNNRRMDYNFVPNDSEFYDLGNSLNVELSDISQDVVTIEIWNRVESVPDGVSDGFVVDSRVRQFLDSLDNQKQRALLATIEMPVRDVEPMGETRDFCVNWTLDGVRMRQSRLRACLIFENVTLSETMDGVQERYPEVVNAILMNSHINCFAGPPLSPPRWNPLMLSDWERGFINLHAEHCQLGRQELIFYRWKTLTHVHKSLGVEYQVLTESVESLIQSLNNFLFPPIEMFDQLAYLKELMHYELNVIKQHRHIFRVDNDQDMKDLRYLLVYLAGTFELRAFLVRMAFADPNFDTNINCVYEDDSLGKVLIPGALVGGLKEGFDDKFSEMVQEESFEVCLVKFQEIINFVTYMCSDCAASRKFYTVFIETVGVCYITAMYTVVKEMLTEKVQLYVAELCASVANITNQNSTNAALCSDVVAVAYVDCSMELANLLIQLCRTFADARGECECADFLRQVCTWFLPVMPAWIEISKYRGNHNTSTTTNNNNKTDSRSSLTSQEIHKIVLDAVVYQLKSLIRPELTDQGFRHFSQQLNQADTSQQIISILNTIPLDDKENTSRKTALDLLVTAESSQQTLQQEI